MLSGKRILLIIGGGIAAYKALELIRLIRSAGGLVVPVLTRAGAEFVTPLSVSALAGAKVHQDLFDLTEEAEMGHIQLSRAADLVVVAPATADLMAKMNSVRGGWRSRRRSSWRSKRLWARGRWPDGMSWSPRVPRMSRLIRCATLPTAPLARRGRRWRQACAIWGHG